MTEVAKAPLFEPAEARIVHFTGFAHAATHYVELVYPTLAVGLAVEPSATDSMARIRLSSDTSFSR